jgi:hypothetical protein
LFGSVLRAFHPRHARRRASAGDAAAEQAARLKKNVPYKVSKQLVELFGALGTTSWSSLRWRAVVHHVGNRTGLVLCGDLKTAAAIVVKESAAFTNGDVPSSEDVRKLATSYEPLRELLRFAVSEDHFLLREKVGTAIREGRRSLGNGAARLKPIPARSAGYRLPDKNNTSAHRACGAERLADPARSAGYRLPEKTIVRTRAPAAAERTKTRRVPG